jgi:hypothetical protein
MHFRFASAREFRVVAPAVSNSSGPMADANRFMANSYIQRLRRMSTRRLSFRIALPSAALEVFAIST